MAAGDLHALQAALLLLPEHSAKFAAMLFLVPPSQHFQEASSVRMKPASSLFAPGLLSKSENVV